MLVLSRKIGERIFIEPGIEIAVVEVRGGRVRIGIEAPDDVRIRRVAPPGDAGFGSRTAVVKASASSE
jgi:carbon storage regulator